MTVTIRIDDDLRALLDQTAARGGLDSSELIRRAVRRFCESQAPSGSPTPAELAGDRIGSLHSGRRDLSRTSRETLTRMIRDRARRGAR